MKKKEQLVIAKKIAMAEHILRSSNDEDKKAKAKIEIMKISNHIDNIDDMIEIDGFVQEILKKIEEKI